MLLVVGEPPPSSASSSPSLSSFAPSVPSSSPSSFGLVSSESPSSSPVPDRFLLGSTSVLRRDDRVPRADGRPPRPGFLPREGAGEDRGSVRASKKSVRALKIQTVELHKPSVSAAVLPRLDSGRGLLTGDTEPSMASRLSNIKSPYSSSGRSNGQYSSLEFSTSSDVSVINESSCYPGRKHQRKSLASRIFAMKATYPFIQRRKIVQRPELLPDPRYSSMFRVGRRISLALHKL